MFAPLFESTISIGGYAEAAVSAAEAADKNGTFGVGGVLVDVRDGKILRKELNSVISNHCVHDPTAHVERKLVDWWSSARGNGVVSNDPKDMLIVSSLEPCMMCAGALMAAGISCIAAAPDEMAGVGARSNFQALPEPLRERAQKLFSLLGVEGGPSGWGPDSTRVPLALRERSEAAFWRSLEQVQASIAGDCTSQSLDPITVLKRASADVQLSNGVAIGDGGPDWAARLCGPNDEILLSAVELTSDVMPGQWPALRLIRSYTQLRTASNGAAPAPCLLTMEFARPHKLDTRFVCEAGAAGSFLEQPLPRGRNPFFRYPNASSDEVVRLNTALQSFPKLYSEVIGLSAGVL